MLTSRPWQEAQSHRALQVLSKDDWLKELGNRVGKRGWQIPYSETLRLSLYTPHELHVIAPPGCGDEPPRILFDHAINICSENVLREVAELWGYPGHAALLLEHDRPTGSTFELDLAEVVQHWHWIVKAEQKATDGCRRTEILLDQIIFLKCKKLQILPKCIQIRATNLNT